MKSHSPVLGLLIGPDTEKSYNTTRYLKLVANQHLVVLFVFGKYSHIIFSYIRLLHNEVHPHTPVWKVWHFSPRSRVCNQNFQVCKCAIQQSVHLKCAMWSIWFVHIWQTRIGARALGKLLHFSTLAFKLLPVCQCDHFRCITALFLSLPHLCKYSANNGAVGVLSGRKSLRGVHTVVSSKG